MPTLEFKGKQFIYAHHLSVPYRTLEADAKKSVAGGKAADGNMIIQGDNLDALKALLPRYAGRVNCVYIDPPYNTGKEGWCYNDNVNSPLMKRWLADNGEVDREDAERHEKWLCMMWPRLQLLRELLAEDGVIFVSIDDNEAHHLRLLMDEIFGEENFVESLIWKKKGGAGNTESYVGDLVEYVVMYSKRKEKMTTGRRLIENVEYPHQDEDGEYYRLEPLVKTDSGAYRRDTMKFGVINPADGKKIFPPKGKRWTVGEETMNDLLATDMLHFSSANGGCIKKKSYCTDADPRTGVFLNLLMDKGSLRSAKNELEFMGFPRESFDTPKPSVLIKHLLAIYGNKNAIILDSFAGSGTTAHAVLALNKEDGGNRKFILVECEDYANTITAERVRRVIKGVKTARDKALKKGLGGGFSFCTLGAPLELEGMLAGKLPDYDTLARYLAHTAVGASLDKIKKGKDGFFGEAGDYRLHLIYKPDRAFLESPASALSAKLAEKIQKAAAGKDVLVFAPWKFMSQADLIRMRITFCQLPYAVHRLLGDSADVS